MMKATWTTTSRFPSGGRIFLSETDDAPVSYCFVGEWAGPGVPPPEMMAELERRITADTPSRDEELMALIAWLTDKSNDFLFLFFTPDGPGDVHPCWRSVETDAQRFGLLALYRKHLREHRAGALERLAP